MSIEMIIFIINTLLIISVIFIEYKNPSETLLWVVILSIFPILGILIYLMFGSTFGIKLTYMIRSKKLGNEYRKIIFEQLNKVKVTHVFKEKLSDEQIESMVNFNLNYSNSLLTDNNKIDQITSGQEKYERLFKDIEKAEVSIHIQYYSIHNDSVGRRLIELLTDKAVQGVEVKVMYDSIGSIATPKRVFKSLIEAGGKVKKIKPFFTHYRNHRKIVVIDGLTAYIGGMNIGEKYINLSKVKTPWRDTQIRIQGDGVYLLQYYFLFDWFYVNSPKDLNISDINISELFPRHSIKEKLPCQFIAGGVDTDKEYIKMSYMKLINTAKDKIMLQSPYFIPDSSIMDAFKIAAASGVKIELMLPEVKPSFFLESVGNYYISQLIDYGVKVYKYKGYIHAKTISIDTLATCIGSVNMDIRSLKVDDEICAFIYNKKFAESYEEIFEMDKSNCSELDYEAFKNRRLLKKVVERFFRLFEPLM